MGFYESQKKGRIAFFLKNSTCSSGSDPLPMGCFGGLGSSFDHTAIALGVLGTSVRIIFGTT